MRKLLVVYPCVYYITLGRIWHFFGGIALYLFPEDFRCLLIASIMPSNLSGISCFSLSYRLTAMGFLCYPVHEKSPLCVWWFVVNSLYHIEVDFSSFLVHIILAHTIICVFHFLTAFTTACFLCIIILISTSKINIRFA